MAWPALTDYNEAIENPSSCFQDPELRQGQPAVNALGWPMPWTGNFAAVYQVACPATQHTWAVKCFTRAVTNLRDRYQAISAHLHEAHLRFMVDFQYLDPGILVRGQWYPVLKMRWVEGLTLKNQ